MSKQYDTYLTMHKSNVRKGFYWIKEHLPEIVNKYPDVEDLEFQICHMHDSSKDDPDEYDAYDRYFYGNNRSYAVVQDFRVAWLKHIHRNPHHWQHWVLINDDPNEGEIIMDIPYNYVIEMICDWWSFSWSKGNLREIFSWFDERKDYMKLSNETQKTVTGILDAIRNKLDELEDSDKED